MPMRRIVHATDRHYKQIEYRIGATVRTYLPVSTPVVTSRSPRPTVRCDDFDVVVPWRRVRTIHGRGTTSRCSRARRSAATEPQLHRDRAPPARADPPRGGSRGQSPGVARDLARNRPATGRGDLGHPGSEPPAGLIPFSPRAKKAFELAVRESFQLGHDEVGTEHMLLGLVREGEGVAARVLLKLGADQSHVRCGSCSSRPATHRRFTT